MNAAEFDGFPLAIGEVYGIRAWRMDRLGRLRALHIPTAAPWRPGINVAECLRQDWFTLGGLLAPASIVQYLMIGPPGTLPPSARKHQQAAESPGEKKPHDVPVEACKCGIYAYVDLDHEENQADDDNRLVLGVIRGTGRTLIGTRGFRCEKAEIVALLDPTRGGLRRARWRRDQRRALRSVYPDVPLVVTRRDLLKAAPITRTVFEPGSDEFWELPA